jgi:spermidine synthase
LDRARKANKITSLAEDEMFADEIVYTKDTPISASSSRAAAPDFSCFSTATCSSARLTSIAITKRSCIRRCLLANNPRRVLVLGGGDGLALREILKYPSVERVTLVDLDPEMTKLSSRFPPLAKLNQQSFSDPRVQVINEDAFIWVEETKEPAYDAAIVDFPDPNTFALGKLYTTRFYRCCEIATD